MNEAPEKAPLNTAVTRLTRSDNEIMLKLFRTAFCIVKNNFSQRSFPALITLQECNGLRLGKAYRNRMAVSSFISSISCVMQNEVIEKVKSAEFFSLLLDGSTDVSTTEKEIVYVRVIKDGILSWA